ncbi:26S protease regulatory subunit 6B homolog [Plasmodium ovale curtisi]|uniref:26S protease regulatory subunit 6B homolog n=1 Tax=Plasmodium ovale curtisi TaxID=864141 RepID=A0A1A8VUU7_PLAOA|nr:26S protease regulatory subunit 6B homolog [Plasmodium ovale curtisi]
MRNMDNISKYLKEEDYYIKLKILKKQIDVLNIQVGRTRAKAQAKMERRKGRKMKMRKGRKMKMRKGRKMKMRKGAASVHSCMYIRITYEEAFHEEYIKEEHKNLKRELIRSKNEIKRIQSVPLIIGQFLDIIDNNYGIVSSTAGSNYYVRILSTLNKEELKPSVSVALHRHSHSIVNILPSESDSSIQLLQVSERPNVKYTDLGGLDTQKQEMREAVELPLKSPELYEKIGIEPPMGILIYGPPGTGKTMLVKAVANETQVTFIGVVGSEFVQKYLGEGPRMVRDVFRLARENSPSIIFIDEVDAIATKRFDAQTGADREVQRILLELLNQMDGFDKSTNVKVIMATNRADTLDPALLRPGRLDRKIEFPLPDRKQKRLIFQTIISKMNVSSDVNIENFVVRTDKISAADIAAIAQEAGMQAIRKNRYIITSNDFEQGYRTHVRKQLRDFEFYNI